MCALSLPPWPQACGYLSDVDPRHKLNTFILKNPPENKMSKEEKRWGRIGALWTWGRQLLPKLAGSGKKVVGMTGQRNRVKLCNACAGQGSGVPGSLPVRAACVCMCVDVCGRAFTAIAACSCYPRIAG